MKESGRLEEDINTYTDLKKAYDDVHTLTEMASEENDSSLLPEIEKDLSLLEEKTNKTIFRLKLSGEMDRNDAILTLNAGAGGTESCDWAEMLLRMYKMWSEENGYKFEIIDILPGDEAGVKRVMFIISGDYAYGYMKGETGVHRLVRISPFDSSGRRHTSFAACDVIPKIEADEASIEIKESDLRIDTFRASGHGGQHVNKTDSAVRITHLPSGIVVQCQDSPSQFSNKKTSMAVLKARLFEFEKDKERAAAQKRYDEKGDIGWGSQIRSYVFMPYQMVKDHRTDAKTSDVEGVMNGKLEQFIEAYLDYTAAS